MAEIAPGTRLSLRWPTQAAAEVFGAVAIGTVFEVYFDDDPYRTVLRSADVGAEGVILEFEVTGRRLRLRPSDEDRIRDAVTEATDNPGRIVTR